MKKTIALLLSVLLLMSVLTACGGKKTEEAVETPAPTPAPTAAPTPEPVKETPAPAPETPEGPVSPDGSVIFEKDGVKVTTAGLDQDPTDSGVQPIVWVDIENTGDQDAYLGVSDGAINNVMGTVLLVEYTRENGEYNGGNYTFDLTIPAGSSERYALSYYKTAIPGVDMDTLSTLEFSFTMAEDAESWPNYTSALVCIDTGEVVDHADFAALGTVVVDNDDILLVIGKQDYDEFFGPYVDVYAQNRSEKYLEPTASYAEADGVGCESIYYADSIMPGKLSAGRMSFEDGIREMRGFETLTVTFSLSEAETKEALITAPDKDLEPVTVTYPPQVWGEYENGAYRLEVKPKYNDLITVETPENDPDGVLLKAFETASREADDFEGVGWLFSIGKVSEDALHEMLCNDMSGVDVFAKDENGNYYMYYHPTDVRYARATPEEMQRDADQWSMLCEWADTVPDAFADQNGLESVSYGNSELDMYVARAAWQKGADSYLATTEYMDVDADLVDGTPYAEYILQGFFGEVQPEDLPDEEYFSGEHLVLGFPKEDVFLHFFYGDGAYVCMDRGEEKIYYQAAWWDEDVTYTEAMKGWYYAAAEKAGVRTHDDTLERFCGGWHEQIAGRGMVNIAPTLSPFKAKIEASWPDSAAVYYEWKMVAALDEEGRLVYQNGTCEGIETNEDGDSWSIDWSDEESGSFYFNEAGELCWHNDRNPDAAESVFLPN